MSIESEITAHYARKGKDEVSPANQHLHIGGAKATGFVLSKIDLKPGMRVLDIGCGVGGPAIYAAQEYGCHVTGIDLTPEFIKLARERADAAGLAHLLDFQTVNAGRLGFDGESFDAAIMFHTGMNVPNKAEVYAEIARVLKPGGTFLIYDILALGNLTNMSFPVPWAKTPQTSFLEPLEAIEDYLKDAGFTIESAENCRDYAKNAVTKLLENADGSVNVQREKIMRNLKANLDAGILAPHIIIAQKN